MNRHLIVGTVLFLSSSGTFVAAQTGSSGKPPSGSAPTPGAKDAPPTKAQGLNPGTINNGMMGPGMMGPGTMGMVGMMGMCPGMTTGTPGTGTMMGGGLTSTCPGMSARDAKVRVSKQPKGASMVITSDDPQIVARLQSAADGWGGCMMGGPGAQGHMMGQGMMGQGMMGQGMMGQGAGGSSGAPPAAGATGAGTGTCSGMMGPGTDVKVAKVTKGVSFTMTGTDAKSVTRIQKMAEAMRLMHEAMEQ
jgi:hypothetical protein